MQEKLNNFRKQIDALDDKIIEALKERSKIVEQVGELKKAQTGNICYVRPGREASMIKDIYAKFAKEKFSGAAAVNIWRNIIAASTNIEQTLTISYPAGTHDSESLYWLAREYFGGYSEFKKSAGALRSVSDVAEGLAKIAILPMPKEQDDNPWWINLAEKPEPRPNIFANLPLVYDVEREMDGEFAFAVSYVPNENSGDDACYVVLKCVNPISIHGIRELFSKLGANATKLGDFTLSNDINYYFASFDGFMEEAQIRDKLKAELGDNYIAAFLLGVAGKPIVEKKKAIKLEATKQDETAAS